MTIERGSLVLLEYVEKLADGTVIGGAKRDGDPSSEVITDIILVSVGDPSHPVMKGLDQALASAEVNVPQTVTVQPADAYGERRRDKMKMLPIRKLGDEMPAVGEEVTVGGEKGVVLSMGSGRVRMDFNHKHAGKTITLDFTVLKHLESDVDKITALLTNAGMLPGYDLSRIYNDMENDEDDLDDEDLEDDLDDDLDEDLEDDLDDDLDEDLEDDLDDDLEAELDEDLGLDDKEEDLDAELDEDLAEDLTTNDESKDDLETALDDDDLDAELDKALDRDLGLDDKEEDLDAELDEDLAEDLTTNDESKDDLETALDDDDLDAELDKALDRDLGLDDKEEDLDAELDEDLAEDLTTNDESKDDDVEKDLEDVLGLDDDDLDDEDLDDLDDDEDLEDLDDLDDDEDLDLEDDLDDDLDDDDLGDDDLEDLEDPYANIQGYMLANNVLTVAIPTSMYRSPDIQNKKFVLQMDIFKFVPNLKEVRFLETHRNA